MPKRVDAIIRTNLIKFRAEKRYSQREVALVLSISQPSYNQMETGHTRVAASQLYVLAKFYDVPVQLFFVEDAKLNDDYQRLSDENRTLQEQITSYQAVMDFYYKRVKELETKVSHSGQKR
ncbi:helix-turn-helix transcriptional regulator [Parapedobacter sp. ISTM3]|uniref:helix-turn-helix transcriptional regulator n=1 Tax=Parapedobacter sp. ISTM3 TaxID=2800130 RepID=UPI001908911C|nr:helix-turn-helix transcriptional regulator [Parapedobacter sp. ISTM3]MBK1442599.1 helix-turn-helix transcriptional regulator [Parapedobacter sp. ISTM3]